VHLDKGCYTGQEALQRLITLPQRAPSPGAGRRERPSPDLAGPARMGRRASRRRHQRRRRVGRPVGGAGGRPNRAPRGGNDSDTFRNRVADRAHGSRSSPSARAAPSSTHSKPSGRLDGFFPRSPR
jgi:hypothetical protein